MQDAQASCVLWPHRKSGNLKYKEQLFALSLRLNCSFVIIYRLKVRKDLVF